MWRLRRHLSLTNKSEMYAIWFWARPTVPNPIAFKSRGISLVRPVGLTSSEMFPGHNKLSNKRSAQSQILHVRLISHLSLTQRSKDLQLSFSFFRRQHHGRLISLQSGLICSTALSYRALIQRHVHTEMALIRGDEGGSSQINHPHHLKNHHPSSQTQIIVSHLQSLSL